jgi:hypothetical protein
MYSVSSRWSPLTDQDSSRPSTGTATEGDIVAGAKGSRDRQAKTLDKKVTVIRRALTTYSLPERRDWSAAGLACLSSRELVPIVFGLCPASRQPSSRGDAEGLDSECYDKISH